MIPHVAAPLSEGTMTPTETASGRLAPAARLTVAVIAACPFPARRGTPVRIQRLAEELTQRGHRVVVVTYHHGTGEADPSVEVRRIRPIRSYNKLGPGPSYRKLLLLDPMLMVKLAGILRREGVDVGLNVRLVAAIGGGGAPGMEIHAGGVSIHAVRRGIGDGFDFLRGAPGYERERFRDLRRNGEVRRASMWAIDARLYFSAP